MVFQFDSNTNSDRIIRRKLSEHVVDKLRDLIRSGELKPGNLMPSEHVLMDRFGVGRPAVREALQALHNSGLITIAHGERSRVNEITPVTVLNRSDDIARLLLNSVPSNLEHLKQARRMFELGMVRAATEAASAQDVSELRALVKLQADRLGNAPDFIRADMQFHIRIASMVGNPIVSAVSEAMLRWLFEYHASLLHWSGKEDVTVTEHTRIVDLIEKQDPDGAVEAMRNHLDRSLDRYEPHR